MQVSKGFGGNAEMGEAKVVYGGGSGKSLKQQILTFEQGNKKISDNTTSLSANYDVTEMKTFRRNSFKKLSVVSAETNKTTSNFSVPHHVVNNHVTSFDVTDEKTLSDLYKSMKQKFYEKSDEKQNCLNLKLKTFQPTTPKKSLSIFPNPTNLTISHKPPSSSTHTFPTTMPDIITPPHSIGDRGPELVSIYAVFASCGDNNANNNNNNNNTNNNKNHHHHHNNNNDESIIDLHNRDIYDNKLFSKYGSLKKFVNLDDSVVKKSDHDNNFNNNNNLNNNLNNTKDGRGCGLFNGSCNDSFHGNKKLMKIFFQSSFETGNSMDMGHFNEELYKKLKNNIRDEVGGENSNYEVDTRKQKYRSNYEINSVTNGGSYREVSFHNNNNNNNNNNNKNNNNYSTKDNNSNKNKITNNNNNNNNNNKDSKTAMVSMQHLVTQCCCNEVNSNIDHKNNNINNNNNNNNNIDNKNNSINNNNKNHNNDRKNNNNKTSSNDVCDDKIKYNKTRHKFIGACGHAQNQGRNEDLSVKDKNNNFKDNNNNKEQNNGNNNNNNNLGETIRANEKFGNFVANNISHKNNSLNKLASNNTISKTNNNKNNKPNNKNNQINNNYRPKSNQRSNGADCNERENNNNNKDNNSVINNNNNNNNNKDNNNSPNTNKNNHGDKMNDNKNKEDSIKSERTQNIEKVCRGSYINMYSWNFK